MILLHSPTSIPASSVWLFKEYGKTLRERFNCFLWVTQNEKEMRERLNDLLFFLDGDSIIKSFPSHVIPSFIDIFPDPSVSSKRIDTIWTISSVSSYNAATGASAHKSLHIVAPISALMERTITIDALNYAQELLIAKEEIDRDALISWLLSCGYEPATHVERVGEYTVRGDILDIFPPNMEFPVRLLFFGDLIEEIRLFNPTSQRSIKTMKELIILPAIEAPLIKPIRERAVKGIVKLAEEKGWSSEQVIAAINSIREGDVRENILTLMPVLFKEKTTLLKCLPIKETLIFILDNMQEIIDEACLFYKKAESSYIDAGKNKTPPIGWLDEYIVSPDEIKSMIVSCETAVAGGGIYCADYAGVSQWDMKEKANTGDIWQLQKDNPANGSLSPKVCHLPDEPSSLKIAPPPPMLLSRRPTIKGDTIQPFIDHIKERITKGEKITVALNQRKNIERLTALFRSFDMEDCLGEGLRLCHGELTRGFSVYPHGLIFLSGSEFLGISGEKGSRKKRRENLSGTGGKGALTGKNGKDIRAAEKDKRAWTASETEFSEGDFVVHRDYGIGIFLGLKQIASQGQSGEYLALEYRDGDKLYLPVDRIALIQPYRGGDASRQPRLDRLGSSSWELNKKRVKKAILEIAGEVVQLYALRQVKEGHAFSPPGPMYLEFETDFPFEETPDQKRATEEILRDMMSQRPMDRLLCGDVGYGKTEVAMRAAFKAVEDGRQVAVLVPTTLLSEQHLRTFSERFKAFPVNIASLNRFRKKREQQEIIEGLRSGAIDIVIGTHRLLQADCVFKDLGLLIIDEEHRFGVRHKERLKLFKKDVDCLSLTATPIPRTLQLSLLGIRDISVIETPPENRLPIKTFLSNIDEAVIKGAIRGEIERGGQIFYVYNRVKGIERIREWLASLVPGVKIETAHGQMTPYKLEEAMVKFIRGDIDCLVCTTIIESGIDIPSANTMLVHRAESFGLAQLYQLRGRIGRANEQAYAYLLVSNLDGLSRDAQKRLKAVLEMERAGGLALAMEDLKIRGAGNLLGTVQSGQIAKVGYDLFLELLKDAVDELKGVKGEEAIFPEVNLRTPIYIPESYCRDVTDRLRIYRTISMCTTREELDEKRFYLEDVYGPLPVEAERLFEVTALKIALSRLRCVRVDELTVSRTKQEKFVLTFLDNGGPALPKIIIRLIEMGKAKILDNNRLILNMNWNELMEVIMDDS